MPALCRVAVGAARAGKTLDGFAIAHKPLVATAPDATALQLRLRNARERIAFYLSTHAYRPAFEHHGFDQLAEQAAALS